MMHKICRIPKIVKTKAFGRTQFFFIGYGFVIFRKLNNTKVVRRALSNVIKNINAEF